jgi:transposase
MQLYAGIDLHASNNFVAVIDADGKRVFKKKLPNEAELILSVLGSFEEVAGVVVESTFNWYWLVDHLGEAGHRVHLANPAAIQKYSGLKAL